MSDHFEATAEEMRTRSVLAERVDGNLPKREQEYGISGFGDGDRVKVTTYVPTMVRDLLLHRFAEIEWVYAYRVDAKNERVDDPGRLLEEDRVPEIEGVCAYLPVSTLSVKGVPRSSTRLSDVVKTPERAKAAREAFANE